MPERALHWYVLRTKPYREKHVVEQLLRREIEAYSPLLKAFRKYLGSGQRQVEPVFPCYVFAQLDLDNGYEEIRRLGGLRGVVRFGDHVPRLDPEVIEEFRRRETPEGYIRVRPATPALEASEPVQITGGWFAGRDGMFSRYLNAPERVSILLDLLNGGVRVELESNQVKPS